jgi:hypothetical protein
MQIFLLIAGLALLAFGVVLLLKNIKLSKNGITMEAEIIDVLKKKQQNTDTDGYSYTSDMYYPVFKYMYEGQEYTKESSLGVSNSRKYVKGGKLNIVFMADQPEKAKIKGAMNLWLIPGILVLVGVAFLISYFAV